LAAQLRHRWCQAAAAAAAAGSVIAAAASGFVDDLDAHAAPPQLELHLQDVCMMNIAVIHRTRELNCGKNVLTRPSMSRTCKMLAAYVKQDSQRSYVVSRT
jgi:hypothetical protein